ncbi:hypothetical protein ACL02T_32895 [Pseudonocardia sp. RS010]|uniref:hypothetical protein n=1 Tax=Pseudonocardia sp. RS010 TaxID=3385979 RepID=UPI0039A03E7C
MTALRVDFWALDDDNTYLAPLPHVTDWTVSLIPGKRGGVEIKYPLTGLNATVLEERVTRRRDLPIAIRWDGTAQNALHARLYTRDGSDVDETGLITYSGYLNTQRLDEYELGPGDGEDGAHVFPDATAGRIMREVLELAQADGALTDLVWTFTDTHDSNGVAWTKTTNAEIGPKNSLLDIADQLRQWGMAEAEVTSSLEVGLYEPETVGTDHTLTNPPLVLRAGRDLADATRRSDSSGAPTKLLVEGADGIYVEVDDPTAEAIRGRRIVRSVSQGQLATTGAATAYGLLELARSSVGVQETQVALGMHPDHPTPLRDLRPSDWVYRDTTRRLERERIVQLTLSQAGGEDHPKGSVVLGDLISSLAEEQQRQIDGLVGGQVVAGASTPGADVDDGLAPAAPGGVTVDSYAYPNQDGTLAAVTADWPAVTENSDGSQITDLRGYLVRWRYLDPALPQGWTTLPVTTDTDAEWDSLVAGATVEVEVAAQDKWDRTSPFTAAGAITLETDSTPPPTPSAAVVSNYIGLLRTDYDGKGSAGEAMPEDTVAIELHASTDAGYDPAAGPPVAFADGGSLIGQLRGAGSFPWAPPDALGNPDYDTTWYVRLVARDKTGNRSAASAAASGVPGRVEEGDVASVNIGVLTAGILNSLLIVGDRIATGTTGSRVELDGEQGLFCINASEEVVLSYDIDDEILQMIGRLIAGAGAGAGPTITVDPGPPPRILLYPNATQQRYSLSAQSGTRPDGTSGAMLQLNALNSSGQTDGFALDAWSTNVWIGHKITSGGFDGGILKLERDGQAALGNENAPGNPHVTVANDGTAIVGNDNGFVIVLPDGKIQLAGDSGGVELYGESGGILLDGPGSLGLLFASDGRVRLNGNNNAKLWIEPTGSVILGGPNNGYLSISSGGTAELVSAGTVKSFVVDHPDDPDLWLVHGCTESPTAGVEYNGVATIEGGRAVVDLPAYFDALTVPGSASIQLTPYACTHASGLPMLAQAAPTEIDGGRFEIVSTGPDGSRVAWRVFATRRGAEFDVEPRRADYTPHGDGPYRYLTPKEPQG